MSYQYVGQMYNHVLNVMKGWPQPYALDIEGVLSANVNINSANLPPLSGQVVHIASLNARTPNGVATGPAQPVFEMGANLSQVPIFLWPSYSDFDVQNPGVPLGTALGGTTTTPPAWIPIQPSGNLVGIVALGPYEVETTEFDTTQTYLPNDFLRAVTSNTDINAGKLTNQNAATNTTFTGGTGKIVWGNPAAAAWDSVCGVVSRGVYTNALGMTVLALWPDYKPGTR